MKFDQEEKYIIDKYEKGDLKTRKPNKKEIERIKKVAKNTFKKNNYQII